MQVDMPSLPSIPLWLIIVLALVVGIVVYFLYWIAKKGNDKITNNNEYGSSQFATEKELHKTFDKEDLDNVQEYGFPIWFDKDLKYVLVDRQTPHWLFLGSTGSGKSLTAVKPQAAMIATAKKKRSVFFTDPKGELCHDISQVFKDNGYEVLTLDFRNPTLSNKINLLEPIIVEWEKYFTKKREYEKLDVEIAKLKDKYLALEQKYPSEKNLKIQKKIKDDLTAIEDELLVKDVEKTELMNKSMEGYGEAVRLVGSVSEMITGDATAKDPYWNSAAGNLLSGLIFLFLENYEDGLITRDKITLNSILKFQISTTEEENAKKFKKIVESISYEKNSKLQLTNVVGASENTYKSVTAVFGQKMNIFNDLNVANVTSSSDFDFDALGKGIKSVDENGNEVTKPVALFVIVRDEDESYNILVTLIVGLMYKCLVKLAVNSPKQRLPIDIVFMLDEFANCPALPSISAMVTVARSRGMMFQFYIQEYSQLDKVYGKEDADIIKGNAGLVYLKTTSYDTAEAVSKRLGKQTITADSFSRGIGWKEQFSGNKSTSLMGRDLFTPDEIMNLEYKTIIFPIKKSNPIFRDTIPYFAFSKKYKDKYYEGEIHRDSYLLSRLEDKIFTIENMENPLPKEQPLALRRSQERISRRARKSYEEEKVAEMMGEQDMNFLTPAIEELKKLLGANYQEVKINDVEGRKYAEVKTNKILSSVEKNNIEKINRNQNRVAYIIKTEEDSSSSTIEIHLQLMNCLAQFANI